LWCCSFSLVLIDWRIRENVILNKIYDFPKKMQFAYLNVLNNRDILPKK
jgi:transcriptional regulator of acetoin/glycerol metabolism